MHISYTFEFHASNHRKALCKMLKAKFGVCTSITLSCLILLSLTCERGSTMHSCFETETLSQWSSSLLDILLCFKRVFFPKIHPAGKLIDLAQSIGWLFVFPQPLNILLMFILVFGSLLPDGFLPPILAFFPVCTLLSNSHVSVSSKTLTSLWNNFLP